MRTVTSADGTTIAFEQSGSGPTLVLVGGMFEQRAVDSETARLAAFAPLAEHFSVIHYDRRGRGDSGDTQPYSVQREVEDIAAIIDATGGSAFLSGISSGAALAFEAALALDGRVGGLAMCEAPYTIDAAGREAWSAFQSQVDTALAEGRHGDAVGAFMLLLGMPADQLDGMRQVPMWPQWEAVAPTIAYDAAVLGDDGSVPTERASRLEVPTLIIDCEATEWPSFRVAARALADAVPGARHMTLKAQTHEVAPEALAPALIEFFSPRGSASSPVSARSGGGTVPRP